MRPSPTALALMAKCRWSDPASPNIWLGTFLKMGLRVLQSQVGHVALMHGIALHRDSIADMAGDLEYQKALADFGRLLNDDLVQKIVSCNCENVAWTVEVPHI